MSWLIEPETLQTELGADGLLILDCRFDLTNPLAGREQYAAGHIPGAVYAHLDDDLAGPVVPGKTGRHPLPEPEAWQTTLRQWGVSADTRVVVYDGANSMFAARAWWMLRWAGLTDVRVLNGGCKRWLATNGATSIETPQPAPGDIEVDCPPDWIIGADDLMADLSAWQLLDARAWPRYSGETEPLDPKAGHIPGAVCLDFSRNVDAEGRFLPVSTLRQRFAEAGLVAGPEISSPACSSPQPTPVSYCGSGVTACHNILAMMLAGLPQPKLYPGSWSEWVTDDQRPVETST
ncbi:sulfurtransferase [Natronospirillum operosum]|uniref:Sulfurtransferase n=1 Tax=Natronospirillum operosum TaxID=2759953 RepID=A0A4Z0W1F0_9GAMM|nr:sulfurtransferase [Natronospirillum operosum]TGG90243.1 sulfurtransferase [Natronospirillum operosum]